MMSQNMYPSVPQPAYGQVNYPNMYQPPAPQPQSMPQPTAPAMFGKVITNPNEISPQDIPTDGNCCYFPMADKSCIYVKSWNPDCTMSTVKYVPETAVQVKPPTDQPAPVAEPAATQETNLASTLIEHLERIEKAIKDGYRKQTYGGKNKGGSNNESPESSREQKEGVKMENSSYRIVMTGNAADDRRSHIAHYGVKGMKWGVVHDEDKKNKPYVSKEYLDEVAYNSQKNQTTSSSPTQKSTFSAPVDLSKASPEYLEAIGYTKPKTETKTSAPVDISKASKEYLAELGYNSKTNEMPKWMQEATSNIPEEFTGPESVKAAFGAALDVVTSEEMHQAASELLDDVKDVTLNKLEEQNPIIGKAAKAVDNFFEGVNNFIADFSQSVNNIISGIMSWGKKIFGG